MSSLADDQEVRFVIRIPARDHLEIEVLDSPTAVTVRPVGELDLAAAPALRRAVARVIDAGPACLELDLGGLSFIDTSGLHALIDFRDACATAGVDYALLPGTRPVERALEISGLKPLLPFRAADARPSA